MKSYLDSITSPQDLRKLTYEQLAQLAYEIRGRIISVVAANGGHLASNLGAVELTIALHYVFDTPNDKIIWDVGHQTYAHKLLTGRVKEFSSLRTLGGISGFPNRNESEYDVFTTGHSSTSISSALGIAVARDLQEKDFYVVSVIGDGALTGGLAYEALNNVEGNTTKFMVILNDNEMSISKNVGAVAKYLNRILTNPLYNKVKNEVETIIQRVPSIGGKVLHSARRIEEAIKGVFVPGIIFEEMGFRYIGPIDGHDIELLIKDLRSVKDTQQPVILHVLTKKGKGYSFSEESPESFHGTSPFSVETGQASNKKKRTFTDVFSSAICAQAEVNDRVVAVTAAMKYGTGLLPFSKQFPERFFDVGIAEQHAVCFAAGLARQGYRPIVAIYSTFLQRAYDQIMHDVSLQGLPILLFVDRGGLVGEDGATHHGLFDVGFLRLVPDLCCMQPRDGKQLQEMLAFGLGLPGPSVVRVPKAYVDSQDEIESVDSPLELGTLQVLREGRHAYILSIGQMVYDAVAVSKELERRGYSVGVADARFIQPLDRSAVAALGVQTGCLITMEDSSVVSGLGSAILEALEIEQVQGVAVKRLGLPSAFIEHGKRDLLMARYGLSKDTIVSQLETFLRQRVGAGLASARRSGVGAALASARMKMNM